MRGLRRHRGAVYAVGGWADGYTNAIFRLLDGLPVRARALIGPWEHVWPEEGCPGPAIGFLQEALRWWDHWLKGIDTAIMDEPHAARLDAGLGAARDAPTTTGRAAGWPRPTGPRRTCALRLVVTDAAASRGSRAGRAAAIASLQPADGRRRRRIAGFPTATRPTCPATSARGRRALADASTGAVWSEPLELLGQPRRAAARVGRPAPAGSSPCGCATCRPTARRSWSAAAILNLTHRDSHEHPRAARRRASRAPDDSRR